MSSVTSVGILGVGKYWPQRLPRRRVEVSSTTAGVRRKPTTDKA
jgi:hypothetical protein